MHCEMHDAMQQSNCFNLYAHQCSQYNVNMGLLYLNMGLLYHNWGCYTYNHTISTLYRPQVKAYTLMHCTLANTQICRCDQTMEHMIAFAIHVHMQVHMLAYAYIYIYIYICIII